MEKIDGVYKFTEKGLQASKKVIAKKVVEKKIKSEPKKDMDLSLWIEVAFFPSGWDGMRHELKTKWVSRQEWEKSPFTPPKRSKSHKY